MSPRGVEPRSTTLAVSGSKLIKALFALLYGLFCFCVFGIRAVIEGCILRKPGQQFWTELIVRRNQLWDLSKDPSNDLRHAFWNIDTGHKLHYLTNNLEYVSRGNDGFETEINKRPNLVIFLHGWPDSGMLWNDIIGQLSASLKLSTTLIAVDLPGFGGSDGLEGYGPGQVLDTLLEFVLAMRELHLDGYCTQGLPVADPGTSETGTLKQNGKVLIVAHDWGALCGFKLSAWAPELADRFILCNSVLPNLAEKNFRERVAVAFKLYKEWEFDFSRNWLPWKALCSLIPVVSQLRKSSYIFIYNLPWFLARSSITRCNLWSLRFVSSIATGYGHIVHTSEVIAHMANFLGPNMLVCDTMTPDGQGYGPEVHKRAMGDISAESIRYYREGLAAGEWQMSEKNALALHNLDVHSRSVRKKPPVEFEDRPPGRLNAPATIIWGERDPALDARIMLDGVDEYLTSNSQVIRLPKVGHWVPLEGEGPAVLAAIVGWTLETEITDTLEGKVKEVCVSARLSVAK